MVFLRPTIIRNNEQSVNLAVDRYDYIRNAEITGQPERPLSLPNMDAPQLPPLQDGRMIGGVIVQTGRIRLPSAPTERGKRQPGLPPQVPAPQQPAAATPQQ